MGIPRDQPADVRALRTALIYFRSPGASWSAHGQVRSVLGPDVFAGRIVRGVPSARLRPVHASSRNWLLACRAGPFVRFWFDSPPERGRTLHGPAGSGVDRILFLSDAAPHRHSLVCRRLSCRLGLGRDFLLLRPRQRHGRSRTLAQFVAARRTLAQRRVGRPGGQRALLRGHRACLDRVCEDVSGSWCSPRTRDMTAAKDSRFLLAARCALWNDKRLKAAVYRFGSRRSESGPTQDCPLALTPYTGLHDPRRRPADPLAALLGLQFVPASAGTHRAQPARRTRYLRRDADRRRQISLLPVARGRVGAPRW